MVSIDDVERIVVEVETTTEYVQIELILRITGSTIESKMKD